VVSPVVCPVVSPPVCPVCGLENPDCKKRINQRGTGQLLRESSKVPCGSYERGPISAIIIMIIMASLLIYSYPFLTLPYCTLEIQGPIPDIIIIIIMASLLIYA
jgi:hypothetical protein